jgi:hypothetical protein
MQGDLHRIGSVSVWGVPRLDQLPWCVATRRRGIGRLRIVDAAAGRGRVSCPPGWAVLISAESALPGGAWAACAHQESRELLGDQGGAE